MLLRCRYFVLVLFALSGAHAQSKSNIRLPIYFEPNWGQWTPEVQFHSRGPGYDLFLTRQEGVLSLRKGASRHVVRVKLEGADPDASLQGIDRAATRTSYFRTGIIAGQTTGIDNYRRVEQQHVYPGIDLVYYSDRSQLEYDFTVAPGVDPGVIRLSFDGARQISVDSAGDLVIDTEAGELREHKPSCV
jgi:hypothetical protein